jgi:hypothetical protein
MQFNVLVEWMMQVTNYFFQQSIHDRVRSECGGKFKDLLLALLNAVWPEQI